MRSGMLLLLVLGSVVSQAMTAENNKDRTKIAQCRATCLNKFADKKESDEFCMGKPDCLMCWESCELLLTNYRVWGHMCGVPEICFPGCQKACHFYQNGSTALTNGETKKLWSFPDDLHFDIDEKSGMVQLRWSRPAAKKMQPIGELVYVLMLRPNNESQWKEVKQTGDLTSTFSSSPFQVKVIAVSSGGLLAEKVATYKSEKMSLDDYMTSGASRSAASWWLPQLLSLQHGNKESGVKAIITWLETKGSLRYEVTWRVIDDSMEIIGHLHTARNFATLTLWPNALYSVQVRCFGKHGDEVSASKPLLVDTHGLQRASSEHFEKDCFDIRQIALLTGCIGGLILLIVATALFCVCRKNQQSRMQSTSTVFPAELERNSALQKSEYKKETCSRKPSAIILQASNEIKSSVNKLKREFSQKTADMEPLTPGNVYSNETNGAFVF